jgi:hypothetical protein
VIATRRRLIKLASDLREDGIEPFAALHPELYRVRSAVQLLPREVPFLEGARELLASHV